MIRFTIKTQRNDIVEITFGTFFQLLNYKNTDSQSAHL